MTDSELIARIARSVAVVIVTYRSSADLDGCLRSLVGDPAIGTVVVVDSGSADVESLRPIAKAHRITLLELGTNTGFGAACNRGAAATLEPSLLFLNPDTELAHGCVSALALALSNSPAGRTSPVAVVGPSVLSPDGSVYPSARSFPSLWRSAAHAFLGVVHPSNRFSRGYLRPESGADWVSGTAMAVRRDAFEQVGGFDEGYFMYVEDVDLCWRLSHAGWGVEVCEDARVTHHIGGSSKFLPYSMIVAHHRSLWRFAVRTSTGMSRLALPIVAIGLVARGALLAALRVSSGNRAVAPAARHAG